MKPLQDSNAIREWELRFTRTPEEDAIIKERLAKAWLRKKGL